MLNQGGRDTSKKFLGAYAALYRTHAHKHTESLIVIHHYNPQVTIFGINLLRRGNTNLCVRKESKEHLKLFHQYVGTVQL